MEFAIANYADSVLMFFLSSFGWNVTFSLILRFAFSFFFMSTMLSNFTLPVRTLSPHDPSSVRQVGCFSFYFKLFCAKFDVNLFLFHCLTVCICFIKKPYSTVSRNSSIGLLVWICRIWTKSRASRVSCSTVNLSTVHHCCSHWSAHGVSAAHWYR